MRSKRSARPASRKPTRSTWSRRRATRRSRSATRCSTSRHCGRSTTTGSERWEPVLKAEFPLGRGDVEQLFAALRLDTPALDRDTYDAASSSTGSSGPTTGSASSTSTSGGSATDPRLHGGGVVSPRGRRAHPDDRDRVRGPAVVAAIADVGLEGFVNTSYPRALWGLLEGRPERVGVIDVGTNSVKFRVTERGAGEPWRPVVDRAEVTPTRRGHRRDGGHRAGSN